MSRFAVNLISLCIAVCTIGCSDGDVRTGVAVGTYDIQLTVDHEESWDASEYEGVFLGGIQFLDVNDDNENILLTDGILNNVWLVNPSSNSITRLETMGCGPGINWRPIRGHFFGDEILVTNNGPWGLIFHSDGTCKDVIPDTFVPRGFVEVNESFVFGQHYDADRYIVTRYDTEQFIVVDEVGIKTRNPIFSGLLRGGGMVYDVQQNAIYSMHSGSDDVLEVRYGDDGTTSVTIDLNLDDYRELDRDLKLMNDPGSTAREISKVLDEYSITDQFYLVRPGHFIVQTIEPRVRRGQDAGRRSYLVRIIENGATVTNLEYDRRILAVSRSHIYGLDYLPDGSYGFIKTAYAMIRVLSPDE